MTGASADAGERWYQLIQADTDLKLIALSLRTRAKMLRREANGRKFTGAEFARAREMLYTEATECIVIARRAEEMAGPPAATTCPVCSVPLKADGSHDTPCGTHIPAGAR